MTRFTARQVRRSLRRFDDHASDLLGADVSTFDDRLSMFVTFCREDPVLAVVHSQLAGSEEGSDAVKWHEERTTPEARRQGNTKLEFPKDMDERVSLMYQLVIALHDGKIPIRKFFVVFLVTSTNAISESIMRFSEGVLLPLFRELSYRLEDVAADLPESDTADVPAAVLQIMHVSGNVTQQFASGTGHTQIANVQVDQKPLLDAVADLKREIEKLKLRETENEEAEAVVAALEQQVSSASPSTPVIRGLLKVLPTAANIVNIVNTILQLLE